MSARRRLLAFPALGVAGALLWTVVGGISAASGQEKPIVIKRAHEGSHVPAPEGPILILAIGSDARRGNPETGARADSIHVIGIDPAARAGAIVGIPRDTLASIPGRGQTKINAALALGGPDLMTRTVEGLTGCRFDYTMLVAFEGFRDMVDEFGGVPVTVPFRMTDRFADIDLRPGPQTLDGADALGFARSRKTSPRGDFFRSENQGKLMVGALGKARGDLGERPGALLGFLATAIRHVRAEIPLFEALRLGLVATRIDPADVTNVVAEGSVGTAGGASVVRLTSRGLATLRDACDDGTLSS